jgi:fumarate hydratase, class II
MADEHALWGAETAKAVQNFPISGEPIPPRVVRWLASIKSAAARTNVDLGLLDPELGEAIVEAADEIVEGELWDQFPVDVFQTGSGTSSNMNVNEVISALTDGRVHPNDHVNLGQSSNDVFPSAVHLAALDATTSELLPALDRLASALEERGAAFSDVVKAGRTHLMDAVRSRSVRSSMATHRRSGGRRTRCGRRCRRSAGSRSAEPPWATVSTRIPTSPPGCANSWRPR